MINAEEAIFDAVYQQIVSVLPGERFVSQQVPDITQLPTASLYEISNVTVRARQGSTPGETHSRVGYQMDIYAETKSECKSIYGLADEIMTRLNFTRVSGNYIDNAGDVSIHRYTARYEAEVDENGILYRTA